MYIEKSIFTGVCLWTKDPDLNPQHCYKPSTRGLDKQNMGYIYNIFIIGSVSVDRSSKIIYNQLAPSSIAPGAK